MPVQNIAGRRYGLILVIARSGSTTGGLARWQCRCDCGIEFERTGAEIRRTGEKSRCRRCFSAAVATQKTQHGETGTYLHTAWMGARRRCRDESYPRWKDYGGRGITITDRWHDSYTAFRDDVLAEIGGHPPGLTLDRKDNDRGYEPGNVRWATRSEQQKNRRGWARNEPMLTGKTGSR